MEVGNAVHRPPPVADVAVSPFESRVVVPSYSTTDERTKCAAGIRSERGWLHRLVNLR